MWSYISHLLSQMLILLDLSLRCYHVGRTRRKLQTIHLRFGIGVLSILAAIGFGAPSLQCSGHSLLDTHWGALHLYCHRLRSPVTAMFRPFAFRCNTQMPCKLSTSSYVSFGRGIYFNPDQVIVGDVEKLWRSIFITSFIWLYLFIP